MSAEAEQTPSPPSAPAESSAPDANDTLDPVQATSEANIAVTDPNPPNGIPDHEKNDANIDEKAADLAEGAVSGATVVAPDSGANPTTPASNKKGKNNRRSSGIPEHKSSKKKAGKKEVVTNLDAQPGDYYFARMKGHPVWPAVVADEDMLPEDMMGKRPVTGRRTDGSYREDFADGGKNVKDRTYPIMFLSTNEFAWMPNTDLTKLNPEDVENPDPKKLKARWLMDAHNLAKERPDLDYFKSKLNQFELERREADALQEERIAEKAEKAAKKAERAERAAAKPAKGKRKSTVTVDGDDDEAMDESEEAPKSSKKRKKADAGSDGEEQPSKKTQKIKLNATKAANGDSAKSKKRQTTKAKETKEVAPMSEAERFEKKEKSGRLSKRFSGDPVSDQILYLRHKLQKGFLNEKAPQENEMPDMAEHFKTLEQYRELEPNIIRKTKIHKVLKALLKLDSVPRDEEFNFKTRSSSLLDGWNEALAKEETPSAEAPKPATNGDAAETAAEKTETETKTEEPKTEEAVKTDDMEMKDTHAITEPPSAPVEKGVPGNDAKDEATDGDVSMQDASAPIEDRTDIPSAGEAPTETQDEHVPGVAAAAAETTSA